MNPGNGIETESDKCIFTAITGFLFMNPGNGIETISMSSSASTFKLFLIYESRQRD